MIPALSLLRTRKCGMSTYAARRSVSGHHANRNSMDNGRRCCRAEWYSSPQIPSTGRWAVAVAAMVAAPVVVARVAAVRRARSAAVRNPVAAVAGQQMAVAAG
jgi:hypothetical protein